jgi:hypothetical protein
VLVFGDLDAYVTVIEPCLAITFLYSKIMLRPIISRLFPLPSLLLSLLRPITQLPDYLLSSSPHILIGLFLCHFYDLIDKPMVQFAHSKWHLCPITQINSFIFSFRRMGQQRPLLPFQRMYRFI